MSEWVFGSNGGFCTEDFRFNGLYPVVGPIYLQKQMKRKANFEASKQFKEKLKASKAAKVASESTTPASA